MIIDGNDVYSDAQAITGDSDSTNSLNHGNANANIGDGTDLAVVVVVTTGFTFGTATYVQIQLMDSADDSSYATVLETKQLAAGDLTAGKRYVIPLRSAPKIRRYTKVHYASDGTITAGAVDAFLAKEIPTED